MAVKHIRSTIETGSIRMIAQDTRNENAATSGTGDGRPAAPLPTRRAGLARRTLSRLLSLSLFYKVLIANSAIVLLGAVAGTVITQRITSARPNESWDIPLVITFAGAGILLTWALNALLLRAALSPLDRLQQVVKRVREGDMSVRAHPTPLADVQLTRLGETLNQMLDEVGSYEEQVRALSGALIYAQEEERQRIARELHDDTGQVLTLLLIRLKLLEAQPGADQLAAQIAELRGLVSSAIDQVRRLALNLRPPTIDQLGLLPSLRSLGASFTESTHIQVKLDLPREQITLSPERTVAIYRVVQEALTNVAKHANAHLVTVTLTLTPPGTNPRQLRAVIHDDGGGFAPEALPNHTLRRAESVRGVGLFGMEERARLAGGALSVQSAPEQGTTITLTVPLERTSVGAVRSTHSTHEANSDSTPGAPANTVAATAHEALTHDHAN